MPHFYTQTCNLYWCMNSILGNLYFAVAPHAFACLVLQGFSSPEFTSVISDSLRFVSSFVNIKGIQKVHV